MESEKESKESRLKRFLDGHKAIDGLDNIVCVVKGIELRGDFVELKTELLDVRDSDITCMYSNIWLLYRKYVKKNIKVGDTVVVKVTKMKCR